MRITRGAILFLLSFLLSSSSRAATQTKDLEATPQAKA